MPPTPTHGYLSHATEHGFRRWKRLFRENVDMSNTESNAAGGSLEIKDSRTGTSYTVPIMPPATEGDTAIRAMDLRPIKVNPTM